MDTLTLEKAVLKLIDEVEALIPEFHLNPIDRDLCGGNMALYILTPEGRQYGRFWGTDKVRMRESSRLAWWKATQVWMSGYNTGEFEELVFAKKLDPYQFGLKHPDFIGWEGGQTLKLSDGTVLSVGFSGMRGEKDLEIVQKALKRLEKA